MDLQEKAKKELHEPQEGSLGSAAHTQGQVGSNGHLKLKSVDFLRLWSDNRKEKVWRHERLKKQLEEERAAKRRQSMVDLENQIRVVEEESNSQIRMLVDVELEARSRKRLMVLEEEVNSLQAIHAEYEEKLAEVHRDANLKESKSAEFWFGSKLVIEDDLPCVA